MKFRHSRCLRTVEAQGQTRCNLKVIASSECFLNHPTAICWTSVTFKWLWYIQAYRWSNSIVCEWKVQRDSVKIVTQLHKSSAMELYIPKCFFWGADVNYWYLVLLVFFFFLIFWQFFHFFESPKLFKPQFLHLLN